MLSKEDIGSKIEFGTVKGTIRGTIIGQNSHSNYLVKVDEDSPVKGFTLKEADELAYIKSFVSGEHIPANIAKETYWHISADETTKKVDPPKVDKLNPPEEIKKAETSSAATEKAFEKINEEVVKKTFKDYDLTQLKEAKESIDKISAAIQKDINSLSGQDVQTKESTMSKKSAIDIAKSDAEAAAYRVASKKITKGVNQLLTKALKSALPPEHGNTAEEIMKTQIGSALTSLALGWGITYAPGIGQDPRLQRIAEESRVGGTADGMEFIADAVFQHLAPVLSDALQMLPNEDKSTTPTRVAAPATAPAVAKTAESTLEELAEEENQEELEATPAPKRAGL